MSITFREISPYGFVSCVLKCDTVFFFFVFVDTYRSDECMTDLFVCFFLSLVAFFFLFDVHCLFFFLLFIFLFMYSLFLFLFQ